MNGGTNGIEGILRSLNESWQVRDVMAREIERIAHELEAVKKEFEEFKKANGQSG